MSMFEVIKGGKYDFIKNSKVKNKIDEAGRKNIIFVEGKDDERLFTILFEEYTIEQISFIEVGGHNMVKTYIAETQLRDISGIFGIIDRDFLEELEIQQLVKEHNRKLYVLERYTIENYLIESSVLLGLIKDKVGETTISIEDLNECIHSILIQLLSIMAGNKLLSKYEIGKLHLSCPINQETILSNISNLVDKEGITINFEDLQQQYLAYYEKFLKNNSILNELQKLVNGKYFLFNFNHYIKNTYDIKGLSEDLMTKCHLARILKVKGIQPDLKRIIDSISA